MSITGSGKKEAIMMANYKKLVLEAVVGSAVADPHDCTMMGYFKRIMPNSWVRKCKESCKVENKSRVFATLTATKFPTKER